MKRLLVIAASLAFSAGAAAQMYKWKDKDGHTRYGDVPPPGANASAMRGPSRSAPYAAPGSDEAKAEPKAAGKADAKSDKALTPEQAFRKRQQERAAADQKAQQERQRAEARQANCESAQTQLRVLESGQRISSVDAAGERVYIDDDRRAAETARAQKAVADWCS